MLRNLFIAFVISFIVSYFGVELLEALPELVNKSYQPRLYDLGWIAGVCMVFSPGAPVLFVAMLVQMKLEK